MDEKHFYRVGSPTAAWNELPKSADELDALINNARRQIPPRVWSLPVAQTHAGASRADLLANRNGAR
jgi:hypothetical protein